MKISAKIFVGARQGRKCVSILKYGLIKKNWTLFNIHTSDKLEIFFDHSIVVNAALMALTHGVYTIFLAALTMKTVYTPWVNALSAAFTEIE